MVLVGKSWKLLLISMCVVTVTACESGGVDRNNVLEGKIKEVGNEYGNLDTDIAESLVEAYGLRQGDKFLFSCNDKSFTATLASDYGDVPRGDWLGLVNWEENLRLARSFANAAETSGCGVSDVVTISPVP